MILTVTFIYRTHQTVTDILKMFPHNTTQRKVEELHLSRNDFVALSPFKFLFVKNLSIGESGTIVVLSSLGSFSCQFLSQRIFLRFVSFSIFTFSKILFFIWLM